MDVMTPTYPPLPTYLMAVKETERKRQTTVTTELQPTREQRVV